MKRLTILGWIAYLIISLFVLLTPFADTWSGVRLCTAGFLSLLGCVILPDFYYEALFRRRVRGFEKSTRSEK